MRRVFRRAIVAGAAFALAAASQAADVSTGAVDNAVAQIIVESQAPNWFEPWRPGTTSKSTGSGFVIKGRRLLTNAHVVSWAREIYVKRTRDNEAYPARVTFIAHDCDLAILEISANAEKFFADTAPLEFSGLPEPLSVIEFARNRQRQRIVLDAAGMPAATQRVLERYGIPEDRYLGEWSHN
jgi:S1-C subfamily serine protease